MTINTKCKVVEYTHVYNAYDVLQERPADINRKYKKSGTRCVPRARWLWSPSKRRPKPTYARAIRENRPQAPLSAGSAEVTLSTRRGS